MAEDTANKTLIKALNDGRNKTIESLGQIIKKQKEILASSNSTEKEIKEAAKKQLKAAKARDALIKQQVTLSGDLKKNFKDIGNTITGGLEGMLSEAFGPLGGIAASLTTGFFKRGIENKKQLEANQMQVDSTDELVKELDPKKAAKEAAKAKEDGGKQEDLEKSAEETAGGVSETIAELDYSNQWLEEIAEATGYIAANTLSLEDQREMARARGGVPTKKKVKGKKDDGGFSLMDLGITVIAAISGALMGAVAGLTLGFLNMWKNIFKFIGGKLAKMFPNVTKMLTNTFGKGGHISKFLLSIKAFFTENKAFKTISESFTKFKTTLSAWGTKIKSFFKPILDIFSGSAKGSSALGGFSKFKKVFMTFFRIFKTFFAKLFLPLQVIISTIEGFFEAKDAVDKSEGMMATFFNSIIGFFGGILDGLIFGMLDLVKDGISWIAGFLGFEEVEKFLDSFSFSDMFNEFLDDIYAWFNLLFSDPVAALTNLFAGLFGSVLSIGDFILDMIKKPLVWIMELFGWDDAAAATESFSLSGWVMGKWEDVKAWFTDLFAWGKKAGATEEGGWSFMKFISAAWDSVKQWFIDKFTFSAEEVAASKERWKNLGEWVSQKWEDIKDWFSGLFEFEGEGGEKIGLGTKLLNMFTSLIDSIISIIPGFGDAATDRSEDKLKEQKLFEEVGIFGKSKVDISGIESALADEKISKQDIANLVKAQGHDLSEEDIGLLTAIAGKNLVESTIKGENAAKGGFIVNRPTYLPSSGVVVGEHPTWKGGAAKGSAGQSEMVVPFKSGEGQQVLGDFSKSIANAVGAQLNQSAMDKVGLTGAVGVGSTPTVIDNSSQPIITNNTILNSPEPQGPMLPGAGRDTAVSHFRHAA